MPIAEELRRVVQLTDEAIAFMEQAVSLLNEAFTDFASVLAGSSSFEVADLFREIHFRAADLLQQFNEVRAGVLAILQRVSSLLGSGHAPTVEELPDPSKPVRWAPLHERRADQVRRFRNEVGRGTPRRQARGAWLDDNGRLEEIRSGERTESGSPDPWFQQANDLAWTLRLKPSPRHIFALASHVEIKFATRLRTMPHVRTATLLIDRPVCGTTEETQAWRFTCAKLLPLFLPAGVVLTVVDFDGSVYTCRGRE